MIILLEGADCSGKTTLAETIKGAFTDAIIVHHTQHNNSPAEFTRTLMTAMSRHEEGKTTIIDRMWMSEQIYGFVCRGATNDHEHRVLSLIHRMPIVTVMCVRHDVERHISHFLQLSQDRDEMVKDPEAIKAVIKSYHAFWYGDPMSQFPGIIGKMTRLTPANRLRAYYQYDMDQVSAEQFTNWLIRMGE